MIKEIFLIYTGQFLHSLVV